MLSSVSASKVGPIRPPAGHEVSNPLVDFRSP